MNNTHIQHYMLVFKLGNTTAEVKVFGWKTVWFVKFNIVEFDLENQICSHIDHNILIVMTSMHSFKVGIGWKFGVNQLWESGKWNWKTWIVKVDSVKLFTFHFLPDLKIFLWKIVTSDETGVHYINTNHWKPWLDTGQYQHLKIFRKKNITLYLMG